MEFARLFFAMDAPASLAIVALIACITVAFIARRIINVRDQIEALRRERVKTAELERMLAKPVVEQRPALADGFPQVVE